MRTPIVVGITALLLALPVAARQTTPSTQGLPALLPQAGRVLAQRAGLAAGA
jgi:hypothetical protein